MACGGRSLRIAKAAAELARRAVDNITSRAGGVAFASVTVRGDGGDLGYDDVLVAKEVGDRACAAIASVAPWVSARVWHDARSDGMVVSVTLRDGGTGRLSESAHD